jgi:tetratricopeptide (TPR) repeat protein
VRPRGRRAGVEIDTGLFRKARLEAGLSLAEVAGTELSRQAVHNIESGRSRPTTRTLQILARRVGVSAGSLVIRHDRPRPSPPDGDVTVLKKLCETHQYLRAVEVARDVLTQQRSQTVEAFGRHYLGLALARLDRPHEALPHLREARRLFELLNDPWFVAETLDWEAGALYYMEDPGALVLEEEALRWYRALEPRLPETEARMLEHLAVILAKNHSFDRALAYWQEAMRMPVVRDLTRMGRIYHGIGECHEHLGDYRLAKEFIQKAVALFAQEYDFSLVPQARWFAIAENELALVFMRLGEFDRAEECLRSALEHSLQSGTKLLMSHHLLSMGELRAMQGRTEEAFTVVGEAIALAERFGEVLSIQKGYQQLGDLHRQRGEYALADGYYERAVVLLREGGYTERLQECLKAWEAVRHSR